MGNKKRIEAIKKNVADAMLPQNIISIGEQEHRDKNVYLQQNVYKNIHRFTTDKTINESGGILVGDVIEEFGKLNIIVNGFVEARYCEATPTTLKFTHETWEYFHKEIDKNYQGKKIVGWIHTHPDFGIFLSEYDKFIQQNFFKEPFQIAYVIDPIQNKEGLYIWINENIEKCVGFYIYDKAGVKISIEEITEDKVDDNMKQKEEKSFSIITNTAIIILFSIIIMLGIKVYQQDQIIYRLDDDLRILNNNFTIIYKLHLEQGLRIDELEKKLEQKDGIVQEN
ncbi:MAG: hypothetical protein WBL93_13630 [Lutisporaceae bacterium]